MWVERKEGDVAWAHVGHHGYLWVGRIQDGHAIGGDVEHNDALENRQVF